MKTDLLDAPIPTALAKSETTDWASMFERLASNPAVDVSKLSQLVALQDHILDREAKASFDAAFAVMQGEIPCVIEKARTDKTTYATLEDIVEAVRPILLRHHFSMSHRTEWLENGKVKVIGVLAHRDGHERTSEFVSEADQTGSKNAIQALGSSMSYGRRYTTNDLLGIVTRREDDDAESGPVKRSKSANVPKGFDDWIDALQDASMNGVAVLEQAWGKSPENFRQIITVAKWKQLKTTAKEADDAAGGR